jgi:hypothetical protein
LYSPGPYFFAGFLAGIGVFIPPVYFKTPVFGALSSIGLLQCPFKGEMKKSCHLSASLFCYRFPGMNNMKQIEQSLGRRSFISENFEYA